MYKCVFHLEILKISMNFLKIATGLTRLRVFCLVGPDLEERESGGGRYFIRIIRFKIIR